jgi:hypothetical protein
MQKAFFVHCGSPGRLSSADTLIYLRVGRTASAELANRSVMCRFSFRGGFHALAVAGYTQEP